MQTNIEIETPTPSHDPLALFASWYSAVERSGDPHVDTMYLATATSDGLPSLRAVLYKGVSAGRIRFFTSYDGRKATELTANPRAALLFCWRAVERQVRIEGRVEKLDPAESDAYFALRPRESQLGAIVSPQSREIAGLADLETRLAEVAVSHEGRVVPRPASWGGYGVVPDRWEMWIGRMARLHERYAYVRDGDRWRFTMLAP